MSLFFLVGLIVGELCYMPWDFLNICKMLSSSVVPNNSDFGYFFLILLPLTLLFPSEFGPQFYNFLKREESDITSRRSSSSHHLPFSPLLSQGITAVLRLERFFYVVKC